MSNYWRKPLVRIWVTFWFAFNLAWFTYDTWSHDWIMIAIQGAFLVLSAFFLGEAWWPEALRDKSMLTVTIRETEPYPADKQSHDYQMGYADGKADAEANSLWTIKKPSMPPKNPSNKSP